MGQGLFTRKSAGTAVWWFTFAQTRGTACRWTAPVPPDSRGQSPSSRRPGPRCWPAATGWRTH